MSSPQANAVERFVELARTSPVAQAGIVSVCCVAGVSAWLLAPYIKLAASAAKGEALALFYGTPEQRLLDHVKKTAKQGDPQSVLDVIDDFCWKHQWMMNIGNIKGKILDQAVNEAQPSLVVELGCYCGYSAIRISRLLKAGSKFYSIEANPKFAAIARQMIEFAGLADVCTVFDGKSTETLPHLPKLISDHNSAKNGAKAASLTAILQVDLFFIDHVKGLYLGDFKLIEELGYLKKGSTIVADNVIFPGAPDYLKHIRQKKDIYKSTFNATTVEYSDIPDGVEVTVVL